MKAKIKEIAKRYLRLETLETRMSDSLDFHDCAVWNIKQALEEAYNAGHAAGWQEALDREYPDFSKVCHHGKYPCGDCHKEDYINFYTCKDCGFFHYPDGTCMDS